MSPATIGRHCSRRSFVSRTVPGRRALSPRCAFPCPARGGVGMLRRHRARRTPRRARRWRIRSLLRRTRQGRLFLRRSILLAGERRLQDDVGRAGRKRGGKVRRQRARSDLRNVDRRARGDRGPRLRGSSAICSAERLVSPGQHGRLKSAGPAGPGGSLRCRCGRRGRWRHDRQARPRQVEHLQPVQRAGTTAVLAVPAPAWAAFRLLAAHGSRRSATQPLAGLRGDGSGVGTGAPRFLIARDSRGPRRARPCAVAPRRTLHEAA